MMKGDAMADFSIVGVAIGLIFVFALLSILTTSISTLISEIANTRPRNLKADLRTFLGDGSTAQNFFKHPLINLTSPAPPQASTTAEGTAPQQEGGAAQTVTTPRPATNSEDTWQNRVRKAVREFLNKHFGLAKDQTTTYGILRRIGNAVLWLAGEWVLPKESVTYARFRQWDAAGRLVGGVAGGVIGWLLSNLIVSVVSSVIGWVTNQPIYDIAQFMLVDKLMGKLFATYLLGLIGAGIGGWIAKRHCGRVWDSLVDLVGTTRVDNIEAEIFANVMLEIAPPSVVTQGTPIQSPIPAAAAATTPAAAAATPAAAAATPAPAAPAETVSVNDPPRSALKTLYGGTDNAAALRQWFNQWAKNSTAAFRRRQAMFAFIVGLILALAINVDTLQIARALYENADLQAAVNARVVDYLAAITPEAPSSPMGADEPNGADETLAATPMPEGTPAGFYENPVQNVSFLSAQGDDPPTDTSAQTGVSGDASTNTNPELAQAIAQALEAADQLISAGLPVGWEYTPVSLPQGTGNCFSEIGRTLKECDNTRNLWLFWEGNTPNFANLVFRKVIGILLTAIAIAQGAPFWFDLLNRLVGHSSAKNEDT